MSKPKYEYAIQQKWKGVKRWVVTNTHYDNINKAKHFLECHRENSDYYESRITKRAVGKWEVVK